MSAAAGMPGEGGAVSDNCASETRSRLASIDRGLWVLVTLLVVGLLYVARLLLLPIVLALLFALTLSPLVRFARRYGVPSTATASGLVLTLTLTAVAGAYLMSGPVSYFIDRAPIIMFEVNRKLAHLREPIESVSRVGEQLSELGAGKEDTTIPEVRVREPGFMASAADDLLTLSGIALVTVMLTLFLLVYDILIMEKIVQAVPRLSGKKLAVQTIRAMEHEISRYLLSISIINLALGVAVAVVMWLLGMPTPYLWGLLAAALNYMPYIGAIVGAVVLGIVALVSIEPAGQAALVPTVYLLLTGIEGYFVTPSIVGRRLSLNPVIIVIAIAFWGWIWGVAGILVAVPLLIVARILSEHLPGLSGLGHAISTTDSPQREAEPE